MGGTVWLAVPFILDIRLITLITLAELRAQHCSYLYYASAVALSSVPPALHYYSLKV